MFYHHFQDGCFSCAIDDELQNFKLPCIQPLAEMNKLSHNHSIAGGQFIFL